MGIATTRRRIYIRIAAASIFFIALAYILYAVTTTYTAAPAPKAAKVSPSTTTPPVTTTKKDPIGLPVRLVIPKLDIDANIMQLGLTKEGNMDVPDDLINTGWYKYGPRPGQTGSAVIAGHLEGVKEDGVFINLHKLIKGDVVSVKDDNGTDISFTVRETKLYDQHERPTEVFNNTDGSYLNLITCTGTWNTAEQRYSKRLVVFTERSNEA